MKRIWLTGASSGIGAALAEVLLEQGHQLAQLTSGQGRLDPRRQVATDQLLRHAPEFGQPVLCAKRIGGGELARAQPGKLNYASAGAGTVSTTDLSGCPANLVLK